MKGGKEGKGGHGVTVTLFHCNLGVTGSNPRPNLFTKQRGKESDPPKPCNAAYYLWREGERSCSIIVLMKQDLKMCSIASQLHVKDNCICAFIYN